MLGFLLQQISFVFGQSQSFYFEKKRFFSERSITGKQQLLVLCARAATCAHLRKMLHCSTSQ
jgi:hypothetical protein